MLLKLKVARLIRLVDLDSGEATGEDKNSQRITRNGCEQNGFVSKVQV